MATFKVGQRVRIIGARKGWERIIGRETVILEGPIDWFGDIGYKTGVSEELRVPGHHAAHLAPLTDPKADAFLERIRKLKPYDEPKVEPAKVRA